MRDETLLPCGCPRLPGHASVAGHFGLRVSRYLPHCALGTHSHDEARIVVPLAGVFASQYGRRFLDIRQGMALYRPRDDAHVDAYQQPTDCLTVRLPNEGAWQAGRVPFVAGDGAMADTVASLCAEMRRSDTAAGLVREGLALLLASIVFGQRHAERGVPRWVATVRDRLVAEAAAPPAMYELAREVGRDAAYVSATFQRVYGCTAGTYVRYMRLWQARQAIGAAPDRSLSQIALDCGFADQSHFTRHFSRVFHLTPGEYRRRSVDQAV